MSFMTLHDDRVSLQQMLDHAREAVQFSAGRNAEDIESDRLLALALVRLLEVIGEAARRLSEGLRQSHPEVAWSQIIGLRNRLIHGYDTVDNQILWQIISIDLPQLIAHLEVILGSDDFESR